MYKQQKNQKNITKHNKKITNKSKHLKHSPKSKNKQKKNNSTYYKLKNFSQKSQYNKLP